MTRSKVARLIETYELEGVGDELESRWVGDRGPRSSLRDLADYFNRLLVDTAVEGAGMTALDGQPANLYRLLEGEDVSGGATVEAERELDRAGVDVSTLRSDFVSRQAIHTYLTSVRDASYEGNDTDPVEKEVERLQKLLSRTAAVADGKVVDLCHADHLDFSAVEIHVNLRVYCEDCGVQYDIADLRSERECDCGAGQ